MESFGLSSSAKSAFHSYECYLLELSARQLNGHNIGNAITGHKHIFMQLLKKTKTLQKYILFQWQKSKKAHLKLFSTLCTIPPHFVVNMSRIPNSSSFCFLPFSLCFMFSGFPCWKTNFSLCFAKVSSETSQQYSI